MAKAKIIVLSKEVTIQTVNAEDYISLTDIARFKDSERTDDLIRNWLRNRNTIEFVGIWEQLNNPGFNPVEFDGIRMQAGLNSFTLTPKQWIEKTCAIGIVSKSGRYGGTFAHKDIAFEFASWISVEFKLYLIKEFQRLKEQEQKQLGWDIKRNLAKINYRIHTDAIKENLIPAELTKSQVNLVYASEADVLNVALFGMTAKQWRDKSPSAKGNIRDEANFYLLAAWRKSQITLVSGCHKRRSRRGFWASPVRQASPHIGRQAAEGSGKSLVCRTPRRSKCAARFLNNRPPSQADRGERIR